MDELTGDGEFALRWAVSGAGSLATMKRPHADVVDDLAVATAES